LILLGWHDYCSEYQLTNSLTTKRYNNWSKNA
jgi:hypothetical protein